MRHREFLEKILYSTLFVTLFSIQLNTTKVPFALDLLMKVEDGGRQRHVRGAHRPALNCTSISMYPRSPARSW